MPASSPSPSSTSILAKQQVEAIFLHHKKTSKEEYIKSQTKVHTESPRLVNQTLKQLQEQAVRYGLLKSGTRKELRIRIGEYLAKKSMERASSSSASGLQPPRKRTKRDASNITNFLEKHEYLKESETFPRQNTAFMTIHVPVRTTDGKDYSKQAFFKQELSFLKFYNLFSEILSEENSVNIKDGDLILLPPGVHALGSMNTRIRSVVEVMGMDKDNRKTIIQVAASKDDRMKLETEASSSSPSSGTATTKLSAIEVSCQLCRFHRLMFTTGTPVNNVIEHCFILAKDESFIDVSSCRFETVRNGIDIIDSRAVIRNCFFANLASSAISMNFSNCNHNFEKMIIIDQNEMTKCCLGLKEVFSLSETAFNEDTDDFKQKNTSSVIQQHINYQDESYKQPNFVLVLRGNHIHDNEGCPVANVTTLNIPYKDASSAAAKLNEDPNYLLAYETNKEAMKTSNSLLNYLRDRMYVMQSATMKDVWENNKKSCTITSSTYTYGNSRANDYLGIKRRIIDGHRDYYYSYGSQSTQREAIPVVNYEIYLIKALNWNSGTNEEDDIGEYFIPEDPRLLKVSLPPRYKRIGQTDKFIIYHDGSKFPDYCDGSTMHEGFLIIPKKPILLTSKKSPYDDSYSKCDVCQSGEVVIQSRNPLSGFFSTMKHDWEGEIWKHLNSQTYENGYRWSEEKFEHKAICKNGHIHIVGSQETDDHYF